mmetsp:Transcript_26313/g.72630  ORF Transcript_26313/g.72630 Transcript_26313/m.72630 type:complete len:297 (-) Transcript_26313:49-939(-)
MKYSTFAVALSTFFVQGARSHEHEDDHHHDHFHGHGNDIVDCACSADELGIEIDCSDGIAMSTALANLLKNNCKENCDSELCVENYALIQIHHDFCYHDEVPMVVESEFHDFEDVCHPHNCKIFRRPDPAMEDCPEPTCSSGDNGVGNLAYLALIRDNCVEDCGVGDCPDNFRTLRVEHDLCDHTALAANVEEGMHNLEDACANYTCNVWHEEDGDLTVCDESMTKPSAANDDDDEITDGAVVGIIVAVIVGFGVLAFIACQCFCYSSSRKETATRSAEGTGDAVEMAKVDSAAIA